MTAEQLRAVVGRLVAAGQWHDGDPPVLVVTDAGYDVTRLAFLLADLPIEVVGRLRSDAPTSADRLFCHVYGRGKGQAQLIPGWPYSFVAALEPGPDIVDDAAGRGATRAGR